MHVSTGNKYSGDEIPSNLDEQWLHYVVSTADRPTIAVGVRLLENGIEFGDLSMPGANVIDIPATHPLLVEVKWWEDASFHTEQVIWLHGQTQTVQINPESITIQTAEWEDLCTESFTEERTQRCPGTFQLESITL